MYFYQFIILDMHVSSFRDREGKVQKGPKYWSFCPHVLSMPPSQHMDVFTILETPNPVFTEGFMEVSLLRDSEIISLQAPFPF